MTQTAFRIACCDIHKPDGGCQQGRTCPLRAKPEQNLYLPLRTPPEPESVPPEEDLATAILVAVLVMAGLAVLGRWLWVNWPILAAIWG